MLASYGMPLRRCRCCRFTFTLCCFTCCRVIRYYAFSEEICYYAALRDFRRFSLERDFRYAFRCHCYAAIRRAAAAIDCCHYARLRYAIAGAMMPCR